MEGKEITEDTEARHGERRRRFALGVVVCLSLSLWFSSVFSAISVSSTSAIQSPNRSGASIEGIWNSATATPLERPRELGNKPFFTLEEAAAWERQAAKNNEEPPADAPRRGTGTYNTFFREFGTRTVSYTHLTLPTILRV